VDELYVEQDKDGHIDKQIARVRLFFLGFLAGKELLIYKYIGVNILSVCKYVCALLPVRYLLNKLRFNEMLLM
jgi:hypothetical protein